MISYALSTFKSPITRSLISFYESIETNSVVRIQYNSQKRLCLDATTFLGMRKFCPGCKHVLLVISLNTGSKSSEMMIIRRQLKEARKRPAF